jgi:hypothetical protein
MVKDDGRDPQRTGKSPVTEEPKQAPVVNKALAAVCGLFCPGCAIFIATRETPEKRQEIARLLNRTVEELHCDGCRAEVRFSYCQTCTLIACATARGLDFCGACADYPCADLKQFQAARPHRLELWQAQARIREVGYEQWFDEMAAHYACRQCGTLNSAYHLACRMCGTQPSNAYVAAHRAEIVAHLRNRAR